MEEVLFKERLTYAIITLYKDYCRIKEKDYLMKLETFNDFIPSPLGGPNIFTGKFNPPKGSMIIDELPSKTKKNICFFTKNTNSSEAPSKPILFSRKGEYLTTKNHQIIRHFNRPFSSIKISTIERVIIKKGDKITFRVYQGYKNRNFNNKYFKKGFNVCSWTVDLKSGNFKIFASQKNGKKKSSIIKTNSFIHLKTLFNNNNLFSLENSGYSIRGVTELFSKHFNDKLFLKNVTNVLGINRIHEKLNIEDFVGDFAEKFVTLKNIKVPDGNFTYWITNFYPTEKYLKKNDRKLISSILDMFGVKSKIMIKILHLYPQIDFLSLFRVVQFFGKDYNKYIGNINPIILKNSYRTNNHTSKYAVNGSLYSRVLKEKEKENIIKIFNSDNGIRQNFLSERVISLFEDHFSMIQKIRDYDPSFMMRAKTMEEFNDEHMELSKIVSAINKGTVIEYVYDENTIKTIQEPIEILYNIGTEDNPLYETKSEQSEYLYPHILTREEEYDEEGSFMHHCVSSYSRKDSSIIVSVRTSDKKERVTCEFDIQSGGCIQQRYFSNGNPPEKFKVALDFLSSKILKMSRWGTLNWKEKRLVPLLINGVEVIPKLRRVTDINPTYQLPFPF